MSEGREVQHADGPASSGAPSSGTSSRRGRFDRAFLLLSLPAAAAVALTALTRAWGLDDTCLWFDEIFGVHAARHEWGDMWRFLAADLVHPPLFYALLKIWIAVGGESLLWLRLFSVVLSVMSVAPLVLLARELRLTRASIVVSLILFASNGYLIKYAREVRMYSLALALSLASLYLFARLLNSRRDVDRRSLILLFVFNLALIYTHYYGWLVVVGEAAYLALADRRALKSFLPFVAALVACFMPWVAACLFAAGAGGGLAQNIGWIQRPTLDEVARFFALLHEPFRYQQSSAEATVSLAGATLGLLLIGLPVLFLIVRAALSRRREKSRETGEESRSFEGAHACDGPRETNAVVFLLFFTLFPVAVAFLLSHALPLSVWGTRHLIVASAPYMLLAGAALARLKPFWLKTTVLMLLGAWFLTAGAASLMRREPNYIWCAWGELAGPTFRAEARESNATRIYAFEELAAYHLWFALSGSDAREGFRVAVVKGVPGVVEDAAYFLPRRFDGVETVRADALAGERFWLAFRAERSDETQSPHTLPQSPLGLLKERGYRTLAVREARADGQKGYLVLVERGAD